MEYCHRSRIIPDYSKRMIFLLMYCCFLLSYAQASSGLQQFMQYSEKRFPLGNKEIMISAETKTLPDGILHLPSKDYTESILAMQTNVIKLVA